MSTVNFVGQDGYSFFECSSAEARAAIQAVVEFRNGNRISLADLEAINGFERVLKATPQYLGEFCGIIDKSIFNLFKDLESRDQVPTHIAMHAYLYADVRRVLNFEANTSSCLLHKRLFGKFFHTRVFVSSKIQKDTILAASCVGDNCEVVSCVHHTSLSCIRMKELLDSMNSTISEIQNVCKEAETMEEISKEFWKPKEK